MKDHTLESRIKEAAAKGRTHYPSLDRLFAQFDESADTQSDSPVRAVVNDNVHPSTAASYTADPSDQQFAFDFDK